MLIGWVFQTDVAVTEQLRSPKVFNSATYVIMYTTHTSLQAWFASYLAEKAFFIDQILNNTFVSSPSFCFF